MASSMNRESTIGISMTVVATLATHMDKPAAMIMKPNKILQKINFIRC